MAKFVARGGDTPVVGRGITRPPSQLTDDDIDDIMRVNVKTALYGTQAVLPHFQTRQQVTSYVEALATDA